MTTGSIATADLCDIHVSSPERLSVATPNYFRDYGGRKAFHGEIETIRCFESNPLVRKTLCESGNGRVLVVDGGSSTRVAIMGDMLAGFAKENDWAAVIINGCIRDSKIISGIDVGIKAIGTHPGKSWSYSTSSTWCEVLIAPIYIYISKAFLIVFFFNNNDNNNNNNNK